MNHDFLIRITNRIAKYATIAVVYWVFIFLIITVFDLKIFRERMTEMFFLSLLGIFAVLGGALILNVMSNLSKMSAALSPPVSPGEVNYASRGRIVAIFLSFALIAAGLFLGNKLSARHKKALLIASADRLVAENQPSLAKLADYTFSSDYVKTAEQTLNVLNKLDKDFPEVMVIEPDVIDGTELYLGFGGRGYWHDDKDPIQKSAYIYSTSREEREYLTKIFSGSETTYRFHAEKGNYQLYFPTVVNNRKLILYFSDFQRYGKFGS